MEGTGPAEPHTPHVGEGGLMLGWEVKTRTCILYMLVTAANIK